MEKTNAVIWYN